MSFYYPLNHQSWKAQLKQASYLKYTIYYYFSSGKISAKLRRSVIVTHKIICLLSKLVKFECLFPALLPDPVAMIMPWEHLLGSDLSSHESFAAGKNCDPWFLVTLFQDPLLCTPAPSRRAWIQSNNGAQKGCGLEWWRLKQVDIFCFKNPSGIITASCTTISIKHFMTSRKSDPV